MVYNCTFIHHLFKASAICPLCGLQSERPKRFCNRCIKVLPRVENPCRCCHLPLPEAATALLCGRCISHPPAFDVLISACAFKFPVSNTLQQLKFSAKLYFILPLSALIIEAIKQRPTTSLPECIIPIPLHNSRQRQRGFNQAIELAKPVAKYFHISLDYTSCSRPKKTRQQSTLDMINRKQNMINAFAINKKIHYQHVAIFDDVVTTGNTVAELAKQLRMNGVKIIEVWCIARTVAK